MEKRKWILYPYCTFHARVIGGFAHPVLSIIPLTITSTNNFKFGRRLDQTFGFFDGTMDKTLIRYHTFLKVPFRAIISIYLKFFGFRRIAINGILHNS